MRKKTLLFILLLPVFVLSGCFQQKTASEQLPSSNEILLESTIAEDYYEAGNTLTVEEGEASIIKQDESILTLSTGESTDIFIGDTIRISSSGEGVLIWFDDSESRLKSGTELTITKADYNPDDISETHISFSVLTGVVWSKVMTLIHPDSDFQAESGDIVAGVRGSAFNFAVTDEDVYVESLEHEAFVLEKQSDGELGQETTIQQGRRAKLLARSTALAKWEFETIPENRLQTDWFRRNGELDEKTVKRWEVSQLTKLRDRLNPLYGEPGYEEHKAELNEFVQSLSGEKQIKAQARLHQIELEEQLYEVREGDIEPSEFQLFLDQQLEKINLSEYTVEQKEQLKESLRMNLNLMDRSFQGDLTEDADEVRKVIQEGAIEVEGDAVLQQRMRERIDLRKSYEDLDIIHDKLPIADQQIIQRDFKNEIESSLSPMLTEDEKVTKTNEDDLQRNKVKAIIQEISNTGVNVSATVVEKLLVDPQLQQRFLNLTFDEKIQVLQKGF
jgi:hypothetical protein